ncbi:unnamed protein product [Darwinula stevensoni]|uniref:Uncharacterized protein n=1 Tax=Darwinula stevensoni TaxID=69355 RepID=A0A7R8X9D6_9CRUS|nr:unnamed protein product [Darwinula stevensoni]CAG0884251.1 unnamed protein product [Darwinula stevensoni]
MESTSAPELLHLHDRRDFRRLRHDLDILGPDYVSGRKETRQREGRMLVHSLASRLQEEPLLPKAPARRVLPQVLRAIARQRRDSGREGCLCIRLPADYKKNRCSQKLLLDVFFHRFFGPLLVKTPVKVVVVLLTMGLLGLNCWGLSGLKNEFDKTWYLDPGYQKDFEAALRHLFPESGYRVNFFLEDYPKTEAAFKDKLSTFLVFTNKGRNFLRDIKYTGNLLTDFNITDSHAHCSFRPREADTNTSSSSPGKKSDEDSTRWKRFCMESNSRGEIHSEDVFLRST